MTTHLTDTQKQTIRIALAKWMGWKPCYKGCEGKSWRYPDDRGCTPILPDYLLSLDECNKVERSLNDHQHKVFRRELKRVIKEHCGTNMFRFSQQRERRMFPSASAEHRALALYLSLNLGELGD